MGEAEDDAEERRKLNEKIIARIGRPPPPAPPEAPWAHPRAPEPRWGDYGAMLLHGMTAHLPRTADGRLQLERTGPYVPPISFPGICDVIVTAQLRRDIEQSGLEGFSFRPVVKAHVSRVEWTTWDVAPEPDWYPPDGEPEGYVLELPHDPEAADQMGDLYEVVAVQAPSSDHLPADVDAVWIGRGFLLVSARARSWLEIAAMDRIFFEQWPRED